MPAASGPSIIALLATLAVTPTLSEEETTAANKSAFDDLLDGNNVPGSDVVAFDNNRDGSMRGVDSKPSRVLA